MSDEYERGYRQGRYEAVIDPATMGTPVARELTVWVRRAIAHLDACAEADRWDDDDRELLDALMALMSEARTTRKQARAPVTP